jgi:hypothetical protein
MIQGLQNKWVQLNPDVVLLMSGTNDVGQMHPNATVVADMGALLTALRVTLPQARIFVTSILNFYSSDNPALPASVAAYNAALPDLIAKIDGVFVDINSATGMCTPNNSSLEHLCAVCNGPCGGYNPNVCPPKGYAWCHPSGAGYDLVAGVWAQALLPVLSDIALHKSR